MALTAASFISSSAGRARKSLIFFLPICLASSTPFCSASFKVSTLLNPITEPLEPMACAKRPWQSGDAIKALTDMLPADSPTMVMRLGSPPKASMLSFTHWMAAT